jgi:hypothetical protein
MALSQADSDVICIRMDTYGEDPGIRPPAPAYRPYTGRWEPEDGLPRFPEARKGRRMAG